MDKHEYKDEVSIRDAAVSSKNDAVCLEAIKKMINDEYIRDVAIASNNETVCQIAIYEMINDEYLGEVKKKLTFLIDEREKKEQMAKEQAAKAAARDREQAAKAAARKREIELSSKKAAWYPSVREPSSSERTEILYVDPCQNCRCKYRAQAYIPQMRLEVNFGCKDLQRHSTVNADYYWCYKGGPPTDNSPGGWFPGRGF